MIQVVQNCKRCGGSKTDYNDSTLREFTCPNCNGTGVEPAQKETIGLPQPGTPYVFGGGKIFTGLNFPNDGCYVETPTGFKKVPEGVNVFDFLKQQFPELQPTDVPTIVETEK